MQVRFSSSMSAVMDESGNKIRERCDEAGLPHWNAHGLRKAGAAIAAENGATAHQLMSIFGWLTLKEASATRGRRSRSGSRLGQCRCSVSHPFVQVVTH